MTSLRNRLKAFFKGFYDLPIELKGFPHPYSEKLVAARAASLSFVIYDTRQKSRKGAVSMHEATRIARLCVLAEIAITCILRAEGYDARWASEHEAFNGPYDVIVIEGEERFHIDVKCGDVGSTVTLTQSEYDKICGDKEAGIDADPKLADTHHVRADWLESMIRITNFYRVNGQSWKPGKEDTKATPRHKRTFYIGQSFIKMAL